MNETNLGKIHVFPSEDSYNSNKESVGSSDLALVPFTNLPIGTVLPFSGNSIPSGYLVCNGSAISRTTYADLFAVIGTTYGAGDGSTTFNLPNLTDKFIQGSNTAGTVKSAGLPNITGTFYANQNQYYTTDKGSGAFSRSKFSDDPKGNSGHNMQVGKYDFNASNSNSIYGNSTTVQPPALTMRYIIKY